MPTRLLPLFIIVCLLTACAAPAATPTATPLPSATLPPIIAAVVTPFDTPTASPTLTKQPTLTVAPTHTPTPAQLIVNDSLALERTPTHHEGTFEPFNANGQIWLNVGESYQILDLEAGILSQVSAHGCGGLLPGSTKAFCQDDARNFSLYDLQTGERLVLPLQKHSCLYKWSPDGSILYFLSGNCRDSTTQESIPLDLIEYHLPKAYTQTTAIGLDFDAWEIYPSAGGANLVALLDSRIYTYTPSGFELIFDDLPDDIGRYIPGAVDHNYVITWAPSSQQFVFGVTDVPQEIAPVPNFLYLFDFETRRATQIAEAPSDGFYFVWDSSAYAWSPDEKYIAVRTEEGSLCLIVLETGAQTCDLAISSEHFAWSPDGQYLVFIRPSGKQDWRGDLVVLDVQSLQQTTLLADIQIPGIPNSLYWR